jgi:hypothetical protein
LFAGNAGIGFDPDVSSPAYPAANPGVSLPLKVRLSPENECGLLMINAWKQCILRASDRYDCSIAGEDLPELAGLLRKAAGV